MAEYKSIIIPIVILFALGFLLSGISSAFNVNPSSNNAIVNYSSGIVNGTSPIGQLNITTFLGNFQTPNLNPFSLLPNATTDTMANYVASFGLLPTEVFIAILTISAIMIIWGIIKLLPTT